MATAAALPAPNQAAGSRKRRRGLRPQQVNTFGWIALLVEFFISHYGRTMFQKGPFPYGVNPRQVKKSTTARKTVHTTWLHQWYIAGRESAGWFSWRNGERTRCTSYHKPQGTVKKKQYRTASKKAQPAGGPWWMAGRWLMVGSCFVDAWGMVLNYRW